MRAFQQYSKRAASGFGVLTLLYLSFRFFIAPPLWSPAAAAGPWAENRPLQYQPRSVPSADSSATALVPTGTSVGSNVITNTTWTLANSPYVVTVQGLQVVQGVTLTIQPGVEVDFTDPNEVLDVLGRLIAVGTATQPITFTGTPKAPNAWTRLSVLGTPANPLVGSVLDHVTLEYAGANNVGTDFYIENASVSVSNSLIRNSGKAGLIAGFGGVANLANDTFVNNQGYAIEIWDLSLKPTLSNLSASGSSHDAINLFAATINGAYTLPAAGLPYVLDDATLTVAPAGTLTIQPGVEVDLSANAGLEVHGTLIAAGTVTNPITFTGIVKMPGAWTRLAIIGTPASPLVGSVLDHVTIEYAGFNNVGTDLYIENASVTVSNSLIRNSSKDGIQLAAGWGSVIEGNQIVGNLGYGLNNLTSSNVVLAANNWWGSASGPTVSCNPGGSGDRVSAEVAFKPFLTSAGATPDLLAPSNMDILQLTPWRWFIPADVASRAYVTLTLTDGAGQPLPGRTIFLQSTLGSVVDGGITDIQGHTLAYVTSNTPGDAVLSAILNSTATCEFARSPVSKISFSAPGTAVDLMPNGKAPYANDGIQVSPLPVVVGVPTTIRATLVNPNAFPISVDGTLGFAQSGIGLTFGPLKQVQGLVIPAQGQAVEEAVWVPPISGHYCFQFVYSAHGIGAQPASPLQEGSLGNNQDFRPAPFKPPHDNNIIDTARKATGRIDHGHLAVETLTDEGVKGPQAWILSELTGHLLDFIFDNGETINKSLGGDPPRQDYTTLAGLQHFTFTPVQAGSNMPVARAQAINNLVASLLDMLAKGDAATISLDRYAGASENRDITWESQQSAAFFYYKIALGQSMLTVADKLDALTQELRSEGFTDLTLTAANYQAYQQQLATQGYSASDIQLAHSIGLSDADIAQILQEVLAQDPNAEAGSLLQLLPEVSSAWRDAGNVLLAPPLIGGYSLHGAASQAIAEPSSTPNNLARVATATYTVLVANSLSQTATIDLSIRRVDVPPDWTITLPPTITLAAGAQTPITVTVQGGTAVAQAVHPQVAVEGYVNGTLLGGVLLDVEVPRYAFFDGTFRTWMPLIRR